MTFPVVCSKRNVIVLIIIIIIIITIIIITIIIITIIIDINKSVHSPLCRFVVLNNVDEVDTFPKGETINHIISDYKCLAEKEYKRRHDIARLADWKLRCKNGWNRSEKWNEHQPDGVEENETCKILRDMTIQCDDIIEASRPDIVVGEKESNKAIIMDIASPWDHRGYEKESENVEKYHDLKREIKKLWSMTRGSRKWCR